MHWQFTPQPDAGLTASLAQSLGIGTAVAALLVQRGVTDYDQAKAYFRPEWSALHDPFDMTDMDLAVDRIMDALAQGSRLMVYGDYDVDGTCSVALMAGFLQQFTDQVITYIPDRYLEGYGVSWVSVEHAQASGVDLVIALDCGIKAHEQIAHAQSLGIDYVVCDHHEPGGTLPQAVAVLDPKRPDCTYPYKELCGCGVGLKLIHALSLAMGLDPETTLAPYLDLVVTAIAADIVPLTGENRTLAYLGLAQMNQSPRAAFAVLTEQTKQRPLQMEQLQFHVAPRINAAGRIKHGQHAVALLMETSVDTARVMAQEIESWNTQRRGHQEKIFQEALAQIEAQGAQEAPATVVCGHWHKGVIGIVASKLTETYYRPTVVFTEHEGVLHASARSVSDFDLHAALEACSQHLIQFGGHKAAAGMSCEPERYEAFKKAFNQMVAKRIEPHQMTPSIRVDASIELREINPKLMRIIQQMGPFGPGNEAPVWAAYGVHETGYAQTVGADNNHLKGAWAQGDSAAIPFIGFGWAEAQSLMRARALVDVLFSISSNTWNGVTSVQLMVKDIKKSAAIHPDALAGEL
jgi:single-stranded-DNA-specific exonuclease